MHRGLALLTVILAVLVALMALAVSPAAAVTPPSCGPTPPPGSPGCQLPGGASPGPNGSLQRQITASVGGTPTAPYPDCVAGAGQELCVYTHSPPTMTGMNVSPSDQFGNTGGGNPFLAGFQPNGGSCHGLTTCSGTAFYAVGLEYLVVSVSYQYGQVASSANPGLFPLIGTDRYLIPLNGNVNPGTPSVQTITFREPSVLTGEPLQLGEAGTTDGNQVEIVARLQNPQPSPTPASVAFLDDLTHLPLPGGERTVTLPASGAVDVTMPLDTTGYAWLDGLRPNRDMRVLVELLAGGTSSVKSVPLVVHPKPLVLVHGVNADFNTFRAYPGEGGFPALAHPFWRGYVVGDGQAPGAMNTQPFSSGMLSTRGNAEQVARYVQGVRQQTNAAHVDLVAHSLGGLISRRYIHEFMPMAADGKPVASHLVTMGTPHLGGICGDILSTIFLSARQTKVGIEELTTAAAVDFNRDVTNRKGVRFSGLVGDTDDDTCSVLDRGDGYVTLPSARWELTDTETLPIWHTDMTSSPAAFAFILPRLALDRTQAHLRREPRPRPAEARAAATPPSCAARSSKPVQLHASFVRELKARGKAKFAIPVSKAKRLNLVMLLPLSVRATLRDPKGKVRDQSAETPGRTDGSIRTLTVRKPRAGKWQLELVQTAARPDGVAVAAVLAGSKERLRANAKRGKRRTLLVTATAQRGKRRLRGLRVSGRISVAGQKARGLKLQDTGRRGDRKARDGTYTARVRPAPAEDVRIAISAKGKGFGLTTVTGACAG